MEEKKYRKYTEAFKLEALALLKNSEKKAGQIERELIWALLNGKAWKLSEARVKDLRMSCITEMCKSSNQIPRQ